MSILVFTYNPILGVLVAIIFIMVLLGAVFYLTKDIIAEQKILVLLIFLITGLMGVWMTDKVIAFKVPLLTQTESDKTFNIIDRIITFIMGYYFATKKPEVKK